MLALDQLNETQIDNLISYISEAFRIDRNEVERDLYKIGVPVRAEGLTVFAIKHYE